MPTRHLDEVDDGVNGFLLDDIDGENPKMSGESSDLDITDLQAENLGVVETEGGLGRHLGLYSTTLLIINSVVGSGIFSTPSSIITSVGSVGPALLLWVLGFVIAFCGLFVWLEWGCIYPQSGGEKLYLEAAFPKPRLLAATLFTVQVVLMSSAAGGCIVFAENMVLAAGYESGDTGKRVISIIIMLLVTLMHSFIPRLGVRIMDSLAMVKIFILLFIDLTGLYILTVGIATIPGPKANFQAPFAGASHSSYDYALALLKVLASYYGWSYPAYVLNEVRNPVRTLKIAGPLGLSTVGILYLLANIAFFAAATPKEIGESGVTVAALFMGKVFGDGARRVAAAFVAVSALGYVMTHTFSVARIDQELAKEGMLPFPAFWASNWPRGAPSAALMLVFLTTFIQVAVIPFGDSYNFILDVLGYPTALMSACVCIGLFLHRRRTPNIARPFRVYTPIALLFLLSQVFLVITPFIRPEGDKGDTSLPYWLAPTISVTFVCGGVAGWFIWRIVIPSVGRFVWVTEAKVLMDGTVVVTWVKSEKSS